MKYKFDITYIPAQLVKINEKMSELDPGFGNVAIVTTLELSHTEEKSVDDVKQSIMWAFQSDGHKVFKIEGGIVE